MLTEVTKPSEEIAAMETIANALDTLDQAAVRRVLHWACARFGATAGRSGAGDAALTDTGLDAHSGFESLADLYAATDPGTEADRALVAGYWYLSLIHI